MTRNGYKARFYAVEVGARGEGLCSNKVGRKFVNELRDKEVTILG